jgi:glucokinase
LNTNQMYIAVDIGGTQLRAALYPDVGIEPIDLQIIPTQAVNENPVDRLLELVSSVWPNNGTVRKIGVGVAGPVNPKTGVVFKASNISGWINVPLGQIMEKRFQTPVAVGNDANLAALGEWKHGAGINHHDLIYLTISTGIGSGIIIDDRLLVGPSGIAGEVGHITVLPGGPICGCGHRGHLESISSGTGIANFVIDQLEKGRTSIISHSPIKPTARIIAEAAVKGDELAIEAFENAGEFLGRAIADLLHIFNPTIVILGGGVSKTGSILMDPVRRSVEVSVIAPEYLHGLEIKTAMLGDQAGLVGALVLAQL